MNISVPIGVKMVVFSGIVVLTILYECVLSFNGKERKSVDILEMKCQKTIFGLRWVDCAWNDCEKGVEVTAVRMRGPYEVCWNGSDVGNRQTKT